MGDSNAGEPHTEALGALQAGRAIAGRRARILDALYRALLVLGLVAYVPSVWIGIRWGAWWIVGLDTFCYAAVVVGHFGRGLGYRVRARMVIGLSLVLGVAVSVWLGPMAAGALWLAVVPVLASILMDRRETLVTLAAVTLAAGAAYALAAAGTVSWPTTESYTSMWLIQAGNLVMLGGVLGLAVNSLMDGLEESVAHAERLAEELVAERRELRAQVEERERVQDQLIQSEKLSAVGTLASGIAHDMNNLLVPVLTAAEALGDSQLTEPQRRELLDEVLRGGRAGKSLVRRILSFARPSSGERGPVDAAWAATEAVELLRSSLPSTVELRFGVAPEAGSILITSAELTQIVLNLGTNAATAMPDGGVLDIDVRTVPAARVPQVEVVAPETGRFVRIRARDSGIGMDKETLRRVFEPFFTTRPGRGNGIGMSTVYGIVKQAGGFISVESTPGDGTEFKVFVPEVSAGAGMPAGDDPPPAIRRGSGERVLVVDDQAGVRTVTLRVLERLGYQVVGAEGLAAARRAVAEHARFDLVLTDYDMPDGSGLEVARKVREWEADIAIILMSGLVDDELVSRAHAAGIDRVLPKPFERRELGDAVADTLAAHIAGPGGEPSDRGIRNPSAVSAAFGAMA